MLSDHEGFGVPLVEAMGHGTPVVAYRAGAVPEVLGDAGVLLDRKRPADVAVAVGRLLDDPGECQRLVDAGYAQVECLDLGSAGNLLVDAVRRIADRTHGAA